MEIRAKGMIREWEVLIDTAGSELPACESHCLLEEHSTIRLVQIGNSIDGPDDKLLSVEAWLFGVLGEFKHASREGRPVDRGQGSDKDAVLNCASSIGDGAWLPLTRRCPATQRLPAAFALLVVIVAEQPKRPGRALTAACCKLS